MIFCTLSWIEPTAECDEDGSFSNPAIQTTVSETYGPFRTEEEAETWEQWIHPEVKGRPGYKATISEPIETFDFRSAI